MRLPGAAARRRWLQLRIPLAEPAPLRAGGLAAMATGLARLGMAAVLICDGYHRALPGGAPGPADGAPARPPRPGNAVAVRAKVPGLSPLHCPDAVAVFYGARLLLWRLGLGGLRARQARQLFADAPRPVAGKEPRGLARDRPLQLAFQQSVKAGYADGLDLPGGLKGRHSGEEALARHPLSFPEAAGGDHRLVEAIVAAMLPAR